MDKNGKLFGKINLIDLLVILLIVAVAVGVGLKMTGRMGAVQEEGTVSLTYTVRVKNMDPAMYEEVESFLADAKAKGLPGDRLMANGALLNGYVTGVEAEPHHSDVEVNVLDELVIIPVPDNGEALDVTFTVEAQVPNNVKTEVGTQEVRVGKGHIVKTGHFEFSGGLILTCDWADGVNA